MIDIAHAERQALIHDTAAFRHQQKLKRAKAWLGNRHVLHPDNHVEKAPHRQPEITRVDVARTIRRYRQRAGLDLAV